MLSAVRVLVGKEGNNDAGAELTRVITELCKGNVIRGHIKLCFHYIEYNLHPV